MLSSLTLSYLVLVTNMIWLGGGISFRFQKSKSNLHKTLIQTAPTSRLRISYQICSKLVNITYVIFVACRLFSCVTSSKPEDLYEEGHLAEIIQLCYVLTCYTVSSLLNIQTLLKGDITPYFIFEYLRFYKDLHRKYVMQSKKSLVKCNVFLTVLFVVGNLIYVQNFILMMKKPQRLHFFTSILEDGSPKILRLLLVLMQCWVWYNLWTNIYFYIFSVYIYACGGIYILRELNPRFKGHRTTSTLRETKTFLKVLSTFRVLHSLYKSIFKVWFQPTQKANTICIAILAVYGMIKLDGRQARIMAFAAGFSLLYLASLYRKLGVMYEASWKLRETWQYSAEASNSRWMKTYLKGVPDFRVDVANYYFVRKTTVANVIYTILNGSITLLMTF